jgi:von Willebrand factor type D domain
MSTAPIWIEMLEPMNVKPPIFSGSPEETYNDTIVPFLKSPQITDLDVAVTMSVAASYTIDFSPPWLLDFVLVQWLKLLRTRQDACVYVPPPPPRRLWGDPHLQTLDGTDYDFNGHGEYIGFCGITKESETLSINDILQVCAPTQTQKNSVIANALSIHFRFAPLHSGNVGTVTVGVAIRDPMHVNGSNAISVVPHVSRRIDVYDGATFLDFLESSADTNSSTSLILESGLMVVRNDNVTSVDFSVTITTPSGVPRKSRSSFDQRHCSKVDERAQCRVTWLGKRRPE